jgi:hypothetical protein
MSSASIAIAFTAGFVAATVGYGVARGDEPIELDASTVRLEGWFEGRKVEWILFPTKDFDSYYPFDRKENEKCVTLVNGTGMEPAKFAPLEGRRVVVTGVPVRYADLKEGTSDADRLLAKRYYEDTVVEDFCYRNYVFVVREIKPK